MRFPGLSACTKTTVFEYYDNSIFQTMKEFKALPKEKKKYFLKKLQSASKKKRENSMSSSSSVSSITVDKSSSEDKLTDKIISTIEKNVRKSIEAELEKIRPQIVEKENIPNSENIKLAKISEKSNLTLKPSVSATSTESKISLEDIENDVLEFKQKEKIENKVRLEKGELVKNCSFMISFSAQADEENIDKEIRALYKQDPEVNKTNSSECVHSSVFNMYYSGVRRIVRKFVAKKP
jgi:hypothetical protein